MTAVLPKKGGVGKTMLNAHTAVDLAPGGISASLTES